MEKEKKKLNKIWHPQQEKILKMWGESSSCYRYMHFKAYQKLKKHSFRFTLPIIIISTITGTANFAQGTFPSSWNNYVPAMIGSANLFAAILTTVMQFMKVNELMEGHRVSAISYGKLSRSIRLELSLPINERTHDGQSMVDLCNTEYDRLIEQSPSIPSDVITEFDNKFPNNNIFKPEINNIVPIETFDTFKETELKFSVVDAFKKHTEPEKTLQMELAELQSKNLVSHNKADENV